MIEKHFVRFSALKTVAEVVQMLFKSNQKTQAWT